MGGGTVTASALNLRDAPDGAVVGQLPRGARVEILDDQAGWLEVAVNGVRGFVSAQYVQQDPAAGSTPGGDIPPEAAPGDLTVTGNKVYGPGGLLVGTLYKAGLFNYGQTSLAGFIAASPEQVGQMSPSRVRVLNAVSSNEGKLEAINTWDNSFLSFGAYQWTAGQGSSPGELAYLISRIQATAPDTFQTYFGSCGLGVARVTGGDGRIGTGFLTVDGSTLDDADSKQALRQNIWAYRFWRAGHDPVVRRCQAELAAARIDLFRGSTMQGFGPVSDYLTSEEGIALLLDEHVNRPGHVPGTLLAALEELASTRGKLDPSGWGDDDEAALIKLYLQHRATTNMTDSDTRAAAIAAAVQQGRLSAARGSFRG